MAGGCNPVFLLLQECSKLGIKGKDIHRELTQLLQQLPGLYQEALSDINGPDITSAMDHYAAVTAYAHSPAPNPAAAEPSPPQQQAADDPSTPQQQTPTDPSRLLPHLHSIRNSNDLQQLGDGTSQAANSPSHAANSVEDKAALQTGDNQEIQWDITDEADNESRGPADVTAGSEGGGDIDWDVAVEPASETAGMAVGSYPPHPPSPYLPPLSGYLGLISWQLTTPAGCYILSLILLATLLHLSGPGGKGEGY